MSSADAAYWALLAQVSPVLALALVLEARTVVLAAVEQSRSPTAARSDGLRIQVWSVVVGGIGSAATLFVAMNALRLDRAPSEGVTLLVQFFFGASIAGAMATPFVSVLMAVEPRWVARLLAVNPYYSIAARRIHRRLRKTEGHLRSLRRRNYDLLLSASTQMERAEKLRAHLRAMPEAKRAETAAAIRQVEDFAAIARTEFRAAIVREMNFRRYRVEVRRFMREMSAESRARLIRSTSVDPVLGVLQRARLAASEEQPDDGGFLWEIGDHRLPDLDLRRTTLVDDSQEFYLMSSER